MKRFHEAPLDIFEDVQKMTDGDYCLVHLLSNERYYKKFKKAVKDGREVILDNSLFELRTAWNGDEYVNWIKKLKPTYCIVPDSWHNSKETIKMFNEFDKKYNLKKLPCKIAGVVQGETFEEIKQTYEAIKDRCDLLCFNFDASWYADIPTKHISNRIAMSVGRYNLIRDLFESGVIDVNKKHHLLGVGVPAEASWYSNMPFVYSIDTCSPVVEGMMMRRYDKEFGTILKTPVKLCDLVNEKINESQKEIIQYNINVMKNFANEQ